ncbi:alpha-ketoglutarate-dependent dioxygenase AlkB [Rhodococcus ruber]|uniref:alpha-ketoglutarate-dependent dioxygenase AlkB n=1 Tax=Rhodococcus ruber TaxID=1830 RepID=UPI001D19221A|nr:alpha-ketoglutarate-dependent dioxygenase AlkB [Rhodococcus ruber]
MLDVIRPELSARVCENLMNEDRHHVSEIITDSERHLASRLTSSYSDVPLLLDGMQRSLPWTAALSEVRDVIAQRFGAHFNYALANLYRNRADHTGWHSDKAWLHEPGSTIAIVSFGATRSLEVRPLSGGATSRFELIDSSVALMDLNMQQTHEHRIPPEHRETSPRLSITLREIIIHPDYLNHSDQPSS